MRATLLEQHLQSEFSFGNAVFEECSVAGVALASLSIEDDEWAFSEIVHCTVQIVAFDLRVRPR